MNDETPFNPLDKRNLGESVAEALLVRAVVPLPPEKPFKGAGIYAIYYIGDFPAYQQVVARNLDGQFGSPIYVGKAVPAGARKGGFGLGLNPGRVLHDRLSKHAASIEQVKNLDIKDFRCRFLVVEDIWIPLAESLLIQMYRPIWNHVIAGFGNNDPGKGRMAQARSSWDVLHPGRPWAERISGISRSESEILRELELFLAGAFNPPPLESDPEPE